MNNMDFTTSTPIVDTTTNLDANVFTATQTNGNYDLSHELVDPNPIEVSTNFSTQQTEYNQYQTSEPATFDTTQNVDINTFEATTTQHVVEEAPAFDTAQFAQSEPAVEQAPAFDNTQFTQSEPVVEQTPAFDTTQFTQSEPIVDTTTTFDATQFTHSEPVVDTTTTFDATQFTQN